MKDITIRSGEIIAAEINYIKKKTQETMLSAAVEIGRLLCEAKTAVSYGEWGRWLEENVDYSVSTANNLMRLYNEYGEKDQQSLFEDNSTELFAALSPSQALALTVLPKEERVEFVEQHNMESLSVRKLQDEIDQIRAEKAEAEKRSQADIATLKNDLAAEKAAHKQAEATLKAVKSDKAGADKTIEELKVQLEEASKPVAAEQLNIDVEAMRSEIAAEYTEKIGALEAQNAKQEEEVQALTRKLSAASSAAVQKFAVHFALWQEEYQTLAKLLTEILEESPDQAEKLKNALVTVAEKMIHYENQEVK